MGGSHSFSQILGDEEFATDPEFADQGVGEQTCSVNQFFLAWQALGKPADTNTAAVVTQNTGVSNPFTGVSAAAAEPSAYTRFTPSFTSAAAVTTLDFQR